MTGRTRWLQRLAVVLLLIGVVVALGFLWRVSPLKTLVADGRGGRRPGTEGRPPRDGFRGRDDGAFSLGNLDDLAQTVMIGVVVLGIVVVVDRVRRRRRPIRP